MNFDFSDEQKILKESARKFLAHNCPMPAVRAVLDNPDGSYDPVLWKGVADMGWLGVTIPEEHGGSGLGATELCAIAEELGRVLAPIPFSSTIYLFTEALLLAGSEPQKTHRLPLIATGGLIGCLATSEGPGAMQTGSLSATVIDGRITGTKIPVTDGEIADQAIVLANEGRQPSLFIVDLTSEGVTRRPLRTLDPTRGAAALDFAGAPAEALGGRGEGATLLRKIHDRAAAYLAFEQLGGADRSLEMACGYALERYTFGRQIGSYQAIKHKLADIYIRNQIARSHAYYGAWALDGSKVQLARAAAAARVAASDAYWLASKEMIHVFGGIGTTWEADCHLFYRRAQQLALAIGAPALWKERLVTELERGTAL